MANWEKKSAYLLREIVKFRTYIDSLSHAAQMKEKIYREREDRDAEKDGGDASANGVQSEERAAVSGEGQVEGEEEGGAGGVEDE